MLKSTREIAVEQSEFIIAFLDCAKVVLGALKFTDRSKIISVQDTWVKINLVNHQRGNVDKHER